MKEARLTLNGLEMRYAPRTSVSVTTPMNDSPVDSAMRTTACEIPFDVTAILNRRPNREKVAKPFSSRWA